MGNLVACCSGHIGERLTNCGIQHITKRSAEDPEATGLAEAFQRAVQRAPPQEGPQVRDEARRGPGQV